MKTLLVGEAPPKSRMRDTPTSLPFSGAGGRRFSNMLGEDVTQVFETRNLIAVWPGAGSKGSLFPLPRARAGLHDLMKTLELQTPRLILAGQRVATAFRLRDLPQLEWHTATYERYFTVVTYEVAIIPHPSAVNRTWNDPVATERVRDFLLREKERTNGTA